MSSPLARKQPALGAEPAFAVSLQWQHRGDPAALWHALHQLHEPGVVIGVGAALADAAGVEGPVLPTLERLQRGRHSMPSTPADLWALVPAHDASQAFDHADALARRLAGVARLVESLPLFSYRHGHDLSGYKDGTENPQGDAAWAAALVPEGEWAGASVVLVQRWRHFRERFAALPPEARDLVIGRRLVDDEEIAEAPESAHVKRTAQEDFEPPAFLLRRSMPWGDLRRHGLQFVAFAASADPIERQLRRMMGLEDGLPDALLNHSQAETGALFWCPPWDGQRLLLPATSAAIAPTRAVPPAAPARVTLVQDGPYELTGALWVDGQPAREARLCRCGRSATRPWCDGSHADAGFVADGDVPPIDEPQAAESTAPLRVQPLTDGPLVLHGVAAICSASGRTITRCAGATLCRCGRSLNKPFCDGSHAQGFTTDPGA
ncbi:MAG: Dyp-type peroxidase [Rubrivivax sp.]